MNFSFECGFTENNFYEIPKVCLSHTYEALKANEVYCESSVFLLSDLRYENMDVEGQV